MFPSCHPTCPKDSRAVIPFPLSSTLHDRSRVLRCHNLRPDPTGGLMGVSRPATISSLPGAEPVKGGLITLDDGTRCIIMYHQGHLKAVTDTEVKSLIRLDEAPATVTRTAGSLIVMRHRGMYSHILSHYPAEYWTEECEPEFRPFERMGNTRYIPGRGCRVTVCSSENQESTRGMDCSMAHLSEVAFWRDSLQHNPLDLIRSVSSGIAMKPMTCVVLESTANGVGNFFHREWLRATEGKSDKAPFFVPWYEIDMYASPVDDPDKFYAGLNDYERKLWEHHGCTLEAIQWYRRKASEYIDRRSMMAEFPSTAEEAFTSTETNVFSADDVKRLRDTGCSLIPLTGEVAGSRTGIPSDISEPHFTPSPQGKASIWVPPRQGASYIASLDIGGRSYNADYSVITVLDRHSDSGSPPEVAAQWRGHIDHDLLAWIAAAMAKWYNTALLVVESNTWETSSEGSGQYILRTLADEYPNMYFRANNLPGFHTNVGTKASLIAHLIRLVREGGYIEHDNGACDELLQYEALSNGSYAARRGCHDDILMSRAIALWVHATEAHAACPDLSDSDLIALMSQ